MGARINLQTGSYQSGMAAAIRSTMNMQTQIVDLDHVMGRYYDSSGRLREANGRFAASAGTATQQIHEQQSAMGGLASKAKGLIGILGALGTAVAGAGLYKWLIEPNAQMEQYKNTLTTVLKSEKKAVDMLEWANKFAAQTPFEIPQIVEASTIMTTYGMDAKKTMGIIGDMASVMGKDLMQAVEAVADAQTGELERLKEFGITKKMIEDQASKMNLQPFDSKGSLADQEALNKSLFAIMQDRYKGGMAMQATSFKGMLSNASDFISGLGRQLGKPIFEGLKKQLGNVLGWANSLQESGAIDAFVAKVQRGFSALGEVVAFIRYDIIGAIWEVFDDFVSKNTSNFVVLGNAFSVAFSALKSTAMPIINWLVMTALPAVLRTMRDIGTEIVNMAVVFVSNFQKFKPYIIGVSSALLIYAGYLKLVAIQTKIVKAATAAWNVVMKMNPVILIVTAIGLLIGYIIKLAGGWDVVKQKIIAFLPTLKMIGTTILNAVMPILRTFASFFISIWNSIKTNILPILMSIVSGIFSGIQSVVSFIQEHWTLISTIISIAWAIISSYVMAGINFVKSLIVNGFQLIGAIVSNVWGMIESVIQIAWSIISGLISTGLAILQGDWSGAWDAMVGMLDGVWSGIKGFFGSLKDLFFESGKAIINTLVDGIKAVASGPVDAIKGVLGKVREFLPFSDAKKGPLSELTYNGGKIVTTMAEGIYKQRSALASAMDNVLMGTPQVGLQASTSVNAELGNIGANIPAGTANPAGTATRSGNISKQTVLKIESGAIQINSTDGRSNEELGQFMMDYIYERLKEASEIVRDGPGMSILLD